MIRLCRFEMTRLLLRRRWLLVVPVSALIAYVSVYSLVAPASIGASLNIWDGLLAAFNSQIFFAVFVPLYVFLVGDCLLADWSTCYSWTVLARVSSRSQWWRAKVVTIMTAALIYVLVAMLTALAVSSLRHLPFATRFSSYALGQGLPRLYQVVWPRAPGAFLLVLWVFTALGLGAFALLAIGVSMWWPRPFVPLGFAVGVIVLSHGLVVRYHSVIPWTIVWRLMYGGHFQLGWVRDARLSLITSLAIFVIIILLMLLVGGRRLSRMDL
jgi:hypothetical protein